MRHRKKVAKLSRKNKHRKMMLRNLATDILKHGRVTTTVVKAKAVRSLVERLITYGKKGTLAARRNALRYLTQKEVVYPLFNVIAPFYQERNGGYTRILKLDKFRRGDNAQLAIIELVDYENLYENVKNYVESYKNKKSDVEETQATEQS